MFAYISSVDTLVTGFAIAARSEFMTTLFLVATSFGNVITVCAILVGIGVFFIPRGMVRDFVALIVSVSGAIATVDLLKFFIGRPRPGVSRLVFEHSSSFPSAHAALAISLFVFLGYICLRERVRLGKLLFVLSIVLAIVIGLSRVYLGVHFISDVIAGWVIGLLWVVFASRFLRNNRV